MSSENHIAGLKRIAKAINEENFNAHHWEFLSTSEEEAACLASIYENGLPQWELDFKEEFKLQLSSVNSKEVDSVEWWSEKDKLNSIVTKYEPLLGGNISKVMRSV